MHLLPCPNCQTDISVTPAQAGDTATCAACQTQVAIPKLGELRQLPVSDDHANDNPAAARSVAATIVFVASGLIAVAAFMGASYNAIRWATIKVEATTESHLAAIEQGYKAAEPASMVQEFESMEKNSLDLITPYKYQTVVNEKNAWGRSALIAGAVSLFFGILAIVAALKTRKAPESATG